MATGNERYIYLQNDWVTAAEAVVPVEDRGYQLADGVYEVVRIYRGAPFALEPHLKRLARSAGAIDLTLPTSIERMAEIIKEAPSRRGLEDAQVYIQVTRGVAPRVHYYPEGITSILTVYASPAPVQPPEAYESGLKGVIVPDERWLRCDIKSISLLPNAMAKERARRAGAVEALLEREGVGMTEGSSSNLFIVSRGRLLTAPAGRYILQGITRDLVLEMARTDGMSVEERFFTRDEMLSADEVFITSTNIEVLPITLVGEAVIGTGRPGPIARRLEQLYTQATAQAVRRDGSRV